MKTGVSFMNWGYARLTHVRRAFSVRLFLLAALASLALGPGCGGGVQVNPALLITDPQEIENATKRGITLIGTKSDPYSVYNHTTKDVNQWVGSDIIVRTAAICLPDDELAFQVAMGGDTSEEGAKRIADAAIPQINRQVKFTVVLQITKSHKPEDVTFELLGNDPKPYPPVAVEPPQFVQDIPSLDPDKPTMAVYGYNVYFSTTGSPGFPALDASVAKLNLLIESGGTSVKVPFSLMTGNIGK
jgi:hypothetical protein